MSQEEEGKWVGGGGEERRTEDIGPALRSRGAVSCSSYCSCVYPFTHVIEDDASAKGSQRTDDD